MSLLHQEQSETRKLIKNKALFWTWPQGKDSAQKRGTVILMLLFNDIVKAILKLQWESKKGNHNCKTSGKKSEKSK